MPQNILARPQRRLAPIHKAHGFTMFEAIVAVIVTSVGLLGVAALQGTAIGHTKKSSDRSIAATQMASLVARMKSSQNYWQTVPADFDIQVSDAGTISGGAEGTALEAEATNCYTTNCTTQRAIVAYSLRKWIRDGGHVDVTSGFADRLASPVLFIQRVDATLPVMLDVTLQWQQKAINTGFNMAAGYTAITNSTYGIRVQI